MRCGRLWCIWAELEDLCQIWPIEKSFVVFWGFFGILIFRDLTTLLAEEIHDLPDETTLTSSGCFLFRFIFLFPVFFLIGSRLFLYIFCSMMFSFIFFGRLSIYVERSVSRSARVPNFAMSEFLTRTSCLFGSLITLVVGLTLQTVLLGANTSYKPSRFFFCRWFSWSFGASFTCMLRSEQGNDREIPSDLISRCSPSFRLSCLALALALAAQMTRSIYVSEKRAVSAHCSSDRYDRPGIVSSSK